MTSPTMIERPDGSWITASPPLRESLPDATRREFDLHTLDVWRRLEAVSLAQRSLDRFLYARDVVDTEKLAPLLQDIGDERDSLCRAVSDLLAFCLAGPRR